MVLMLCAMRLTAFRTGRGVSGAMELRAQDTLITQDAVMVGSATSITGESRNSLVRTEQDEGHNSSIGIGPSIPEGARMFVADMSWTGRYEHNSSSVLTSSAAVVTVGLVWFCCRRWPPGSLFFLFVAFASLICALFFYPLPRYLTTHAPIR